MLRAFYTTVLIIFVQILALAQTKNAYTIKLKVNGLKDSTCYLAHYYRNAKSQIVKDTSKVDNQGNIIFTGTEKLPEGIYIIAIGKSRSVQLLVAENLIEMESDTSYAIDKIKVLNSKENKLFYEYQNFISSRSQRMREVSTDNNNKEANKQSVAKIQDEVLAFQKAFFEKNKTSFCAKVLKATMQPDIPEAPILANGRKDSTFALRWIQKHYFDNMDLSDEVFMKTPFLDDKLDYYLDNLNYQIPDSLNKAADFIMSRTGKTKNMQKLMASHIGSKYEQPSFMGGDAVFVHVAEKYFKNMPMNWDSSTLAAIEDKRIALKNVLIGAKAQNAILTDTTGKVLVPLYQVKAKYTLMFIYDPDCGHCKERAPKILSFYNKMKANDLKVYAASTVANPAKIKEFIKGQKTAEFINVYDQHSVTDFKHNFNVFTTPQVILLDANKKILARGLTEDQMEDLISKMEKKVK